MEKITYASLGSLGEDFHQAFDAALKQVRARLGAAHPMFIEGKAIKAKAGTFTDSAPADTRVSASAGDRLRHRSAPDHASDDTRQISGMVRHGPALLFLSRC